MTNAPKQPAPFNSSYRARIWPTELSAYRIAVAEFADDNVFIHYTAERMELHDLVDGRDTKTFWALLEIVKSDLIFDVLKRS